MAATRDSARKDSATNSIIEKKRRPLIEGNSRQGTPTKDACYAKAVEGVTPAMLS